MHIPPIITKEFQQKLSYHDVLEILKEGNQRFLNNTQIIRNLEDQRKNLTSAQHPIAVILGCIDSRVPSELIFDLGLGDVFNIRVAGNILNDDILGSIEFACNVVGAKLIVVMGHSDCGAIKAACGHTRLGHISSIMEKIEPVIQQIEPKFNNASNENIDFINEVTIQNTVHVKNQILEKSTIISEMVQNSEVGIVSAVYYLERGKVVFE